MARRTVAGREEELQRGSARFAEWRRTRRRGTPIPVELWELAVQLARRHGVSHEPHIAGAVGRSLRAPGTGRRLRRIPGRLQERAGG
jgi:hypothetical protein